MQIDLIAICFCTAWLLKYRGAIALRNERFVFYYNISASRLFRNILRDRPLIVGCGLVMMVISALYAFYSTPQYNSIVYLEPGSIIGMDSIDLVKAYPLKPEEVFVRLSAALASYENRLKFFNENRLSLDSLKSRHESPEQAFSSFNKNRLKIFYPSVSEISNGGNYVGLSFEYPQGVDGEEVIKNFVKFSLGQEQEAIKNEVYKSIDNQVKETKTRLAILESNYEYIKNKRSHAVAEENRHVRAKLKKDLKILQWKDGKIRENKIKNLDNAIAINKSQEPANLRDHAKKNQDLNISTGVKDNAQPTPLKLSGGVGRVEAKSRISHKPDKFIKTQIAAIRRKLEALANVDKEIALVDIRDSADYLHGSAELKEKIVRLKAYENYIKSVSFYRLDLRDVSPSAPSKPRKSLVVIVGLALGVLLGVSIAIIRCIIDVNFERLRPERAT